MPSTFGHSSYVGSTKIYNQMVIVEKQNKPFWSNASGDSYEASVNGNNFKYSSLQQYKSNIKKDVFKTLK